MKFKYTESCTTFCDIDTVYFYDEIKDRCIAKKKVKDELKAKQLMQEYVSSVTTRIYLD